MAFLAEAHVGSTAVGNLASLGLVSVTVTWNKPFPDTNYYAYATMESPTGLMQNVGLISKTTTSATFLVKNIGLVAILSSTLTAIAIHP